MEATTFNPRGSFGIPQNLRDQLEKQASTKPAPEAVMTPPVVPSVRSESLTETPITASVESSKKTEDEQGLDDLRAYWEKRLEVKIEEKDIRDYIFRGKMVKEGVVVIPDMMQVTFQSITPEDLAAVDQKMAGFRVDTKWTADGLKNENALQVVSYGWLMTSEIVGGVAKTPKAMGVTPEDRYKTIIKIPALAIQEVIDAWDGFCLLIKIALREKRLLKK